MKCNHCLVEFHDTEKVLFLGIDKDENWYIEEYQCPVCDKYNMYLVNYSGTAGVRVEGQLKTITMVRPRGSTRPPVPKEVPEPVAIDYQEACLVLSDSPKASAALSRRCLQNLLRNAAKVKPSDLANEIQEVLDRNTLPSQIAEIIDAVRATGNFAAHPTKSISTGEIVPVEPGEAEANLEVLEALFDFYYVLPGRTKERIAKINQKNADAGKPPIKTP